MKAVIPGLGIVALMISSVSLVCASAAEVIPAPTPVKIILVGDSTTSQHTGWGGAFCDLDVTDMVACLPVGRGGRSTKTYRAEGAWDIVLGELRTPGYAQRYVLIEMGHNDKNLNQSRLAEFHKLFK